MIKNEQFEVNRFDENDLFICAIGYEERSYFLYDKIAEVINSNQILVLTFGDYQKYDYTKRKIVEISESGQTEWTVFEYSDFFSVLDKISEFINKNRESKEKIRIHVDYSSMPRSWYCRIFKLLRDGLKQGEEFYFWYVEGIYPQGYEEYPSAGIDSFSLYSGTPTLRTEKKRVHVLSLSYDTIRTQAMMSILDPESIIVCNAYYSKNRELCDNIKLVNQDVITQAQLQLSIHLDDFSFMLSKLCELAYEYQPIGDVIFIPDGPKPLILAISLVPEMVNLEGVTCLHISRNEEHFSPINVKAADNVFGFSVKII